MWAVLLPPLLCGGLFVLLAHAAMNRNAALRARVTGNPLWKAQFFLHPLIVSGCIWLAARDGTSSNTGEISWWAPIVLAPFVFNFGVEPWDLPRDLVFYTLFYAHHLGALLACAVAVVEISRGGAPTALLFGHCWLLHTIGNLDHWMVIDKQRWFWPYMVQGFVVKCVWCRSLPSTAAVACVAVQYVGRWGLHIRLQALVDGATVDTFEVRKQFIEPVAFFAAWALTRAW
jgi:hypothetical protein